MRSIRAAIFWAGFAALIAARSALSNKIGFHGDAHASAAGRPADDPIVQDPEKLPRLPPKEPADALATFRTLDGFRMELIAHEPNVTDPVAIEYDEHGWAYVAEMLDYPYTDKSTDVPNVERTTDLPIGRVRLLRDTDGDGVFDESSIFADQLSWPTGLACWDGGIFVAATPDIWYFKDTDGDHRADVRERVYTGFRKFNVQAVMNNLRWGLDHWIYGAGGTNGGTIRCPDRPEEKPVTLTRHDFRFEPVSRKFEAISGGARFGNTFDDWGNRFLCNIRNPAQHVVLPSHYLARNPYLAVTSTLHDAAAAGDQLELFGVSPPEPWRALRARRWAAEAVPAYPRSELVAAGFFTSASGVTVYRGTAYPEKYRGNIFVADVAGNLIHRLVVTADGVTFAATRGDERAEFVSSTDNWFRPVNFVNAPDGTLHVLDMYRETIEHPWSIPDDIKAQLDLESGRDRGRIYRLAPAGFQAQPPPNLADSTTDELVGCLKRGDAWWRETAHRLIFERQDKSAAAALRRLVNDSAFDLARLHALWSLDGLGELQDADLLHALSDVSPGVREHAVRLAEPRLNENEAIRRRCFELASDRNPRVRYQVAYSLGQCQDDRTVPALGTVAISDGSDEWIRTAVLSSCAERAPDVIAHVVKTAPLAESVRPVLRQLAQIVGVRQKATELERVWDLVTTGGPAADALVWKTELVIGLGAGFRQAGKSFSAALERAGPGAAAIVHNLIDEAARSAHDQSISPELRVQAIQLMSLGDFDDARGNLPDLLDPRQPQSVQLASARVLASFTDPGVVELLLGRWEMSTPALRAEIADAMLSRADRTVAILDAIDAGKVATNYVSSARRALLLKHSNQVIQSRAAALFGTAGTGPRKQVIDEYEPALSLRADPQRGQRVFERECAACHRFAGKGNDVGPDMAAASHHTPDQMLTHILDPNREVSPNYLEYVVALDDGRVITGVIANESATSIVLRRAEGLQETVLRKSITEIRSSGKSLMPEGLETKVSIQEMADLIAFLLRKPVGESTR